MDAIQILEEQHREVERLFKAFAAASKDTAKRAEIFDAIADQLAAHTQIEEQIFYPESHDDDTEDELRVAVEEHLAAKRLLADLLDLELSDEQFVAKMKVLEETVKHHVHEEEHELFPKLARRMSAEQRQAIGVRMEELLAEIIGGGEPKLSIPAEPALH